MIENIFSNAYFFMNSINYKFVVNVVAIFASIYSVKIQYSIIQQGKDDIIKYNDNIIKNNADIIKNNCEIYEYNAGVIKYNVDVIKYNSKLKNISENDLKDENISVNDLKDEPENISENDLKPENISENDLKNEEEKDVSYDDELINECYDLIPLSNAKKHRVLHWFFS